MFKKNEGTLDRILRVILGLALLGVYFFAPGWGGAWWLLIGFVPLLTGVLGTCPIYSVLGLSTCPMKN
jgi:hypothetical protein